MPILVEIEAKVGCWLDRQKKGQLVRNFHRRNHEKREIPRSLRTDESRLFRHQAWERKTQRSWNGDHCDWNGVWCIGVDLQQVQRLLSDTLG